MIQDWDTLISWLSQQRDLQVAEDVHGFGHAQQMRLLRSFQTYAQLDAPPKMGRMMDIIGEETSQYMLLVAQGMPMSDWPRQRVIAANLVLALLRCIFINTQDDKRPILTDYIRTIEVTTMRPMIEQGIDQAYPILKQAGLLS